MEFTTIGLMPSEKVNSYVEFTEEWAKSQSAGITFEDEDGFYYLVVNDGCNENMFVVIHNRDVDEAGDSGDGTLCDYDELVNSFNPGMVRPARVIIVKD